MAIETKSTDKPYIVTQWQQMTYIVRAPNGTKEAVAKALQDSSKRVGLMSAGEIHSSTNFVMAPREATLEELEEARPAKPELLVDPNIS